MFGRGLGDTYAVFLLPLEREFGWTRSELTSVYSIYLLTHGLTSPLIGVLMNCGLGLVGLLSVGTAVAAWVGGQGVGMLIVIRYVAWCLR